MSELRDTILAADDLPREKVEVAEWDVTVWVRTMTAAERDHFEASVQSRNGSELAVNLENIRAKLVGSTVVDEAGVRVFSDADTVVLGAKSAAAMDTLFAVARRLNGLTGEDVEELVGN